MKDRVLSVWRCKQCNKDTLIVERDSKNNPDGSVSDSFIRREIISTYLRVRPTQIRICENCNKHAVLEFVGMEGVVNEN